MTKSQRRTLEAFAAGDLPLNRAVRAALRRIEDMELIIQEFVDKDDECDDNGETTSLGRRALKLLDRGGKRHD